MFVSYAQNFEDVVLWRALKAVEHGCYIDIGAQDPVSDSVSKAFYDLGWRGTSVEPTSGYVAALRAARPDEAVVEALICAGQGNAIIYEIAGTGLSTMSAELAAQHAAAGHKVDIGTVEVLTLDALLDRHEGRDVHWLKIDTEGSEDLVIASWASSRVRPWIILVESVDPVTRAINSASWEPSLQAWGYRFVYFDGLNKFYLHEDHEDLAPAFSAPPNVFDHFSLSGTASSTFCATINRDRLDQAHKAARLAEAKAAAAEAERARLHRQIVDQAHWWQQRMAEVHGSTSWRVTWPLRVISRGLRRVALLLRKALSLLQRAPGLLVRRSVDIVRRRSPGLFYRLATNRFVRRVYRLVPGFAVRPSAGAPALIQGLPQLQAASATDLRGSLMAGLERWSPGRRIDA